MRSDEGKPFLVFFRGRRTGIGVRAKSRSEAITKARAKMKRGGSEVASVRLATPEEQRQAAKGTWIRTGPNGEAPGKSKLRGYGPKPGLRRDSLTPAELTAFNTALEARKDEIIGWCNAGKSEVYIETRILEGLRNDGVIETEPRMDVKFVDEALHQRVVAEAKRKFSAWPSAYASAWVVAEVGPHFGVRRDSWRVRR
jgi:hypothetical protein